ncbi:MAG: biopolymer transporter ExbD [Candidatus Adiutrix sp.]|jgi:biopolymer transport protein ExbD|nr:biopolymer transporter ExbD [Candidatus Adiutrix sp.]
MNLDLGLADLDGDGLDMTPLIDVLFLLLTFFILAATFVAPALEVQLAQARNLRSGQGQGPSLTFSIDAQGDIYYEREKIQAADLEKIMGAHAQETPIIFNVDQDAPFEAFLTVLDEAKSQNRHQFLINGQPRKTAAAP